MYGKLQEKNFVRGINRNADFVASVSRFGECALAFGGLVVLFPALLLCALLVRLGSPGGVLFRQQRVGRHGNLHAL